MTLLARFVARSLKLPEPPTHSVSIRRSVAVPMSDGVTLNTDLYLPHGLEKPPVVLVRSPYGKSGFLVGSTARPLAERGFLVVYQCCRGTHGSGGIFDPHHDERADGLATIEWIKRQPWFGGAIATFGPSYLGYTQWAVARDAGAEVKAMAMQVTLSNFADMTYAGGSLMLENALSWTRLISKMMKPLFALRLMLGTILGRAPIGAQQWRQLPLGSLDEKVVGARVPFWQDWMEHASASDPWWAPMDFHRTLPEIRRPITMVAGWFDIFLPWQLRDFQELQEAGCPVRITIGPWRHTDSGVGRVGLIDALEWFRATMCEGAGAPRQPPVRVFVTGADNWRHFAHWPPRESIQETWYLQTQRQLGRRALGFAVDHFVYDPENPTPSLGGPSLAGTPFAPDNRELEERADVLCYTSAPLERDYDVVGPIAAELFVVIDAASADFFVRLCDVDLAGLSRNVCDGLRRIHSTAEAGVRSVRIELWPTAHRFKAGHRLRVQVSGGAFPRWARNLGTHGPLKSSSHFVACRIAVHHGERSPSSIRLPVLAA